MVQDRVAEDEVEAGVVEGERSRPRSTSVVTFRPSRFAFSFSASSIPGEMSVAVALRIAPACSRLSVK